MESPVNAAPLSGPVRLAIREIADADFDSIIEFVGAWLSKAQTLLGGKARALANEVHAAEHAAVWLPTRSQ